MKNLNFAAKITKFFLENKALTKLLILWIIFSWIFWYIATPKQYNPKITLPAFEVSVDYYWATADEVQKFITKELEEKIAEIPWVDKISSQSIDWWKSIVNVQFKVWEDLDNSKVKLWTKLNSNDNLRISWMSQPLIKNINPDNVPILTIWIFSDKISQNELRNFAIWFSDKFRDIDWIANIEVKWWETKALKISLDPWLMKFFWVSVEDVKRSILSNNLKVNSWFIKNWETLKEIEFNWNFTNKKDAENLIVIPWVKLWDFAKINENYLEKNSYVEFFEKNFFNWKEKIFDWEKKFSEQKNFVILSFAKREWENAFIVTDKILKVLKNNSVTDSYLRVNKNLGEINFKVLRNDWQVAKNAISWLWINLIQSILIVSIILYLFLGFRPAIIVASAIPMTLLVVFATWYFMDQTINRITLFALILSLWLLVDSATVVTENIYRHMKMDKSREDAIIHAVNEVWIWLLLSTLTSVVVFLPTSQLSWMMWSYMWPLSIFVPIALIMSLFISYAIIPFLALYFLKIRETIFVKWEHKKSFFEKLCDKYWEILAKILNSKKLQKKILFITFWLLFVSFLMPIFKFTHFKMLPTADKNQFYVYVDWKDWTDLPKTNEFINNFANEILKNDNIKNIQSFVWEAPVIDFNWLFKWAHLRNWPNLATLRVNLIKKEDRDLKSEKIVEEIRNEFLSSDLNNENFRIRFVQDPPWPPVQATLVAKIKWENFETVKKISKDVEKFFWETKKVVDIDTSINDNFSKIIYKIDSEKALKSWISSAQISETLNTFLQPQKISQFHEKKSNEISFIELSFPKNLRNKNSDLSQIYLKNLQWKMINLDSIVKKIQTKNPEILFRDEFENTEYVSAEMWDRSVVYAVIDIMKKLLNYKENWLKLDSWNLYWFNFSDENWETYKIEWWWEFEMTLDNFRDLSIAMLFAFVLIYSILVAQFRTFSEPGLIMATIPLWLIWILFWFSILDFFWIYLTATALIWFIALMWIVVNNAIIYLEYLHVLKAEWMDLEEALMETWKTRLRPILLTSITTILWLLTIASDPVWSWLSWAIIFWLSVSTIMTLIIFPILYFINEEKKFNK